MVLLEYYFRVLLYKNMTFSSTPQIIQFNNYIKDMILDNLVKAVGFDTF